MSEINATRWLSPILLPNYTGDIESYTRELHGFLEREITRLNLLLGGRIRWQNLRSQLISYTTPNPVVSPITLTHDLGKVPEFFIPNPSSNYAVWATAANRTNWTSETIELSIPTGGTPTFNEVLTVLVM